MYELWLVIGPILGGIVAIFVQPYLRKKGENLATKEDIGVITREIERVRSEFAVHMENVSQRNRLQLAAVDKRLEAYQEGFEWVVEIGGQTVTLRKLEEAHLDESELQTMRNKLQTMRNDAFKWLRGHYLYLGMEIGQQFLGTLKGDDKEEQFRSVIRAIERAAGLPDLNENWQFFETDRNLGQESAPAAKPKAT